MRAVSARVETREEAYENAAGLLRRMGYDAFVRRGYVPAGQRAPVTALVTCAPGHVLGYAVTITAAAPEEVLPTASARAGKSPAGDLLLAWF